MAAISLRNLTKSWATFTAVKQLNLEIHDKEFIVLLGASGCGKTTTMRMIAGLDADGYVALRRFVDCSPP